MKPHMRIQQFQNWLIKAKFEAAIIEHPTDLYYLTGLSLSSGMLFVHPKESHLFVDGRYFEMAKEKAPVAVSLSILENQNKWFGQYVKKTVILDSVYTSYDRFLYWQKLLKKAQINVEAEPRLLKQLRAIKDPEEIKSLKASASLLWKAFMHARSLLKEGVTELHIAKEFEIYALKHGAQKMAFEPIIAFGKNSAYPHYRAGNAKLKKTDIVLMDLGVVVDSYHSDMTRMIFLKEKDPKLKKMYQVIRNAQAAALSLCKPGVLLKELDLAARKEMQKENLEPLFIHSLGHGVGLDIHEYPSIKKDGKDADVPLQEGMVITIEPGLYLPGKGGVRYEDTILITKKGFQNFYPQSEQ